MAKKITVRENTGNLEILSKHREFGLNTGKTHGILLGQVANILILKVKDIAIVAAKILFFFQKLDRSSIFSQKLDRSAKSVLCM